MTDYVELHARSAFSFLEGATMPELLMQQAAHLEMPAMALLDRNGLYGAARFHMEGKTLRCARAHRRGGCGKRPRPTPSSCRRICPISILRSLCVLPLLAESRPGYQNLSRLLTQFKLREKTKAEGAAGCKDMEEYSEGVVCLTGGNRRPAGCGLARRRL